MKCFTALTAVLIMAWVSYGAAECGYKSCPPIKAGMINVHLVPHSHDDTGWLKTVDQYYYGSNNSIQQAGVQYILDNVIAELKMIKSRRFIQVETAFFHQWYNEQSKDVQNVVKKLVAEGRLEFVGGGWSMHDEATTHFQSVLDQFTFALRFLHDTFGTCARPRVGWQIDPFGHSRESASLMAQMAYDGLFFARMDWVEKGVRLRNQSAEMIWRASEFLGQDSELFTGLLYNHYSAPPGFCFDSLCSDEPIIDGVSHDNNVKRKVDAFIAYINNMHKYYRSSHLLVPMGDDFNYMNAHMNFKNMDKLIDYVNRRQTVGSKINLLYSTPSCYLNALHKSGYLTWPNKTQDFFPYSTDHFSYWTGYFSSRPTQKKFERDGNHFLQVAKQLTTFAKLNSPQATKNLDKLRQAMGVMQHHDAITGTEKQHVANDYNRLLHAGIAAASNNTRLALQTLTNLTGGEFVSCLELNISLCEYTQKFAGKVVVTVFNPLSHPRSEYIRVPVPNGRYIVKDEMGREIESQLVPVHSEVLALISGRSPTDTELVFKVNIEKLANFYITKGNGKYNSISNQVKVEPGRCVFVDSDSVKLTLNENGLLQRVETTETLLTVQQEFFYYRGAVGNNSESKFRSSGAYIFRPNGTEVLIRPRATIKVYNGSLVQEVHQYFDNSVSQVIRIYKGSSLVEFEWMVGPISIADNKGKEVITRFTSSIDSNNVFYTDSNGREMMRRVRNQRENFKPMMNETISGNYYPVTSRIALQNRYVRMALLNDRAQGGSSLRNGELELMLHRRLLHDDAFGVGEALNETAYGKGLVARGKIQLVLSKVNYRSTVPERLAAKQLHMPLWTFFSNASTGFQKPKQIIPKFNLTAGIELLTLEPHKPQEYLLRLESFLDSTETSKISFDIYHIFAALNGERITEMTLDGNMKLSNMTRFKFQQDGRPSGKIEYYTASHTPLEATKYDKRLKFIITMEPMQIRTFIVTYK